MGGDPDVMTTRRLIRALAEAGADLIEVGIPFSDPLADGPIIQRAASRALAGGATPVTVVEALRNVSRAVRVPLVLLSYWNPILHYGGRGNGAEGTAAFLRAAARSGVAGVIVPDLPPEEAGEFPRQAARAGIATVFLASPTSPASRLRQIARASEGFIYYVSLTGTTGVRDRLAVDWPSGVRQLRLITTKPICVGFGISTPAQAARIAGVADGVIVGSALIRAMEPHLRNRRHLVEAARSFVRRFRAAV